MIFKSSTYKTRVKEINGVTEINGVSGVLDCVLIIIVVTDIDIK
jgi:hypothetical protein